MCSFFIYPAEMERTIYRHPSSSSCLLYIYFYVHLLHGVRNNMLSDKPPSSNVATTRAALRETERLSFLSIRPLLRTTTPPESSSIDPADVVVGFTALQTKKKSSSSKTQKKKFNQSIQTKPPSLHVHAWERLIGLVKREHIPPR